MADNWEIEDEWTETLDLLVDKFSDKGRKKRFKKLGYQMKARAKRMMTKSKGFGNERPYAPLKIKYRYHGRKTVAANKRNLTFARKHSRSATVLSARSSRSGGVNIYGVSKVSKTKVTSSTKPLIDRGGFRRSWDVLELKPGMVVMAPDSEFHRGLAAIHGGDDKATQITTSSRSGAVNLSRTIPNRGDWDWGKRAADAAEAAYMKDIDKDIFDK
jgi:hypothetical protein